MVNINEHLYMDGDLRFVFSYTILASSHAFRACDEVFFYF